MSNFWKAVAIELFIFIGGLAFVLCNITWFGISIVLWQSVGCSLIASSIVSLATTIFFDSKKDDPIGRWGISNVYDTRANKNNDSAKELIRLKYKLDGIAFGLKSFRNMQQKHVEECLKRGVNIRFLVMNPDSPYVVQREKEEKESPEQIKNSINQLIQWADKLNSGSNNGKILIKGYNCMTLDFYWRLDDVLYVGPYWYGIDSQQTITYKFKSGGECFKMYTEYFDRLWNDEELSVLLTKENAFGKQKK